MGDGSPRNECRWSGWQCVEGDVAVLSPVLSPVAASINRNSHHHELRLTIECVQGVQSPSLETVKAEKFRIAGPVVFIVGLIYVGST